MLRTSGHTICVSYSTTFIQTYHEHHACGHPPPHPLPRCFHQWCALHKTHWVRLGLSSGSPSAKGEKEDSGEEESRGSTNADPILSCRVNWGQSDMVLPFIDTQFEEDENMRLSIGLQPCGNRDGSSVSLQIQDDGKKLFFTKVWSTANKRTDHFFMGADKYDDTCERTKQFEAKMRKLCGRNREVISTMVLDLPFQVDEAFFVHGDSASGDQAGGVNFVKFENTSQCLVIVDLVKKKAPMFAGKTSEMIMGIPGSVKKANRRN